MLDRGRKYGDNLCMPESRWHKSRTGDEDCNLSVVVYFFAALVNVIKAMEHTHSGTYYLLFGQNEMLTLFFLFCFVFECLLYGIR